MDDPREFRRLCDVLEGLYTPEQRLGIVATLLVPFVRKGSVFTFDTGMVDEKGDELPRLVVTATQSVSAYTAAREMAAEAEVTQMLAGGE